MEKWFEKCPCYKKKDAENTMNRRREQRAILKGDRNENVTLTWEKTVDIPGLHNEERGLA